MRRRTFCSAFVTLVASGRSSSQPAVRKARIGFLAEPHADEVMRRSVVEPFRQGLREVGYVEGENVAIEFRWAEGRHERLAGLAAELLRLDVDVLVAAFPAPALVAKGATRSVPIVAVGVDDPVGMGLAVTMARPGGNITGISSWGVELVSKRLQLLREFVPTSRRVGILVNPNAGARSAIDRRIREWESLLGVNILVYEARGPDDFDGVFSALARDRVDGLVVLADANSYTHRERVNRLCVQRRMPSVWGGRDFLTGGGLASYQSDFAAIFVRAATLVDKILKGTNPADIPFEQATKLELIVDQRAAKALGMAIPQALLLRADEVIQ
ncbi:MAG TPA: ABC transporter substrate-binding protein [Casimicrobiaceae bacterium]|nr:ABC transporter substrate-binding protein [Casimicrobiaceae bacterium]